MFDTANISHGDEYEMCYLTTRLSVALHHVRCVVTVTVLRSAAAGHFTQSDIVAMPP